MRNYKDAAEVMLIVAIVAGLFVVALTTDVNYKFSDFQAAVSVGENDITGVQINNKSHDFGHVFMSEGRVSYVFEIKNISREFLKIEKVYSSSQGLEALLKTSGDEYGPYSLSDYLYNFKESVTIFPGEVLYVEAIFEPSLQGPFGIGLTGPFITLENNRGEKLTLKISAIVLP